MPPALYAREDIVAHVMSVLRRRGYDGASLSELSKATGLGKSSLYHHFPNGKDDMVMAVLTHLTTILRQRIFVPLGASGEPAQRIKAMVRELDAFYAHGTEACVLAQLALGSTHVRFREPVRAIFTEWISALAAVLVDAGFTRAVATRRAEDAIVRIEGALMFTAGMGDSRVFVRTLKELPHTLLR
jgi:AcrR family transcriptional regulator